MYSYVNCECFYLNLHLLTGSAKQRSLPRKNSGAGKILEADGLKKMEANVQMTIIVTVDQNEN